MVRCGLTTTALRLHWTVSDYITEARLAFKSRYCSVQVLPREVRSSESDSFFSPSNAKARCGSDSECRCAEGGFRRPENGGGELEAGRPAGGGAGQKAGPDRRRPER